MKYRIRFRNRALKDIKRLPPVVKTKVKSVLQDLASNPFPSGCKKIPDYGNCYRVKAKKDYRIVYEVVKKSLVIIVIRAWHRKDVYRNL